ncbi:type IX secretion system membrane protein PorP/SprF [Pedobacter gandavensis]|uniref:PorP/SprF family type IX secretion system membrane protein n=1 Tax=Pedobacter gandavensis TaxID=2679963 RepID=UPI00292ED572|nr:type IX secretion system membrane protein PorP/SprF [Pedobacter gandavensis]
MSKWLFLVGVLLSFTLLCHAQQRPQYTQYVFNNYILNPAISGIENYTDVKFGYRNQWTGVDQAPVTAYFSVHFPLGKNYLYGNSNSFSENGDNPMKRNIMHTYMASEPHHGAGVYGVVDKIGPITSSDFKFTYAYHLGLSPKINLSLGVAAGISRLMLDVSKISLENILDPAIADNANNRIQPDLGLGLWLYGADFFAGVSAQQLLNRPVTFTNEAGYNQGKQVPHLFITGGYKYFLSDDIAAIPSVMFKYVSPAPLSTDINLKVSFKDKFWLGGSYRSNDAAAIIAGFNINALFVLGYSYDFTTSQLGTVSKGSHEVVLGILLNNRYKVTCPQKNW